MHPNPLSPWLGIMRNLTNSNTRSKAALGMEDGIIINAIFPIANNPLNIKKRNGKKEISLADKLKIIHEVEVNHCKQKEVAARYGVSKQVVSRVMDKREVIKEAVKRKAESTALGIIKYYCIFY